MSQYEAIKRLHIDELNKEIKELKDAVKHFFEWQYITFGKDVNDPDFDEIYAIYLESIDNLKNLAGIKDDQV